MENQGGSSLTKRKRDDDEEGITYHKEEEEKNVEHKRELSSLLRTILDREELLDVTFVCEDGTSVRANRALLAIWSEYFSKLLYGDMKESSMDTIPLPTAKAGGLQIVISYVHGHPFRWGADSCWVDLIEAYCLASQYQINSLCERILLLVRRVAHAQELGDLLHAAIPRQAEEVLNALVEVMNEVWAFDSKSFLGWSKESIQYCLENVTFYPNVTETMVAEAVLCAASGGTGSAGVEPNTADIPSASGSWCAGSSQQNTAHTPSGNQRAGIEQGAGPAGHIPSLTGNSSQAGIQPSNAAQPLGYWRPWQPVIPFGYKHHDAGFQQNTAAAAPIPFGYGPYASAGIQHQNTSHLPPQGNWRAGYEQNTSNVPFGNSRAGLEQNTAAAAAAKKAEKPVVPRIHACKKKLKNCEESEDGEVESLECSLSREDLQEILECHINLAFLDPSFLMKRIEPLEIVRPEVLAAVYRVHAICCSRGLSTEAIVKIPWRSLVPRVSFAAAAAKVGQKGIQKSYSQVLLPTLWKARSDFIISDELPQRVRCTTAQRMKLIRMHLPLVSGKHIWKVRCLEYCTCFGVGVTSSTFESTYVCGSPRGKYWRDSRKSSDEITKPQWHNLYWQNLSQQFLMSSGFETFNRPGAEVFVILDMTKRSLTFADNLERYMKYKEGEYPVAFDDLPSDTAMYPAVFMMSPGHAEIEWIQSSPRPQLVRPE